VNFNLEKAQVRILEPFAVFAIIAGLGINIVVPLIAAAGKINSEAKAETNKIIWFIAAVCALTYSLVVLRYLFKNGSLDRLLYFIMAAIFLTLVVLPFYLP
jgi:hypothetical protein